LNAAELAALGSLGPLLDANPRLRSLVHAARQGASADTSAEIVGLLTAVARRHLQLPRLHVAPTKIGVFVVRPGFAGKPLAGDSSEILALVNAIRLDPASVVGAEEGKKASRSVWTEEAKRTERRKLAVSQLLHVDAQVGAFDGGPTDAIDVFAIALGAGIAGLTIKRRQMEREAGVAPAETEASIAWLIESLLDDVRREARQDASLYG
jgi:hypothetical protein